MSNLRVTYASPPTLAIAETGKWNGKAASIVQLLARRTTFANTTPFQDVGQYLVGAVNAFTNPAVGTTYYANSTSANDTAASAGISKVRIVSLDAAGNQQVTSVTLNGATPVSIGAGYTYFQWMEASEMGTAGLVAAGDVTISSVNGAATESTTHLMIKAGGNKSLDGKYKVPTGYTAYIDGMYGSAIGQAMDLRLRVTAFTDDRTVSTGIYHFNGTLYLASGTAMDKDLPYLKCVAGTDIKFSALPAATTGSPRCDAAAHLLVVSNT